MYERTNASVKPRLLGIEEFMAYTSLGRGSALKLGQENMTSGTYREKDNGGMI